MTKGSPGSLLQSELIGGRASLNFEQLTTMLAEIEVVLNSRSLSNGHNDSSEPQPLKTLSFPGWENT